MKHVERSRLAMMRKELLAAYEHINTAIAWLDFDEMCDKDTRLVPHIIYNKLYVIENMLNAKKEG